MQLCFLKFRPVKVDSLQEAETLSKLVHFLEDPLQKMSLKILKPEPIILKKLLLLRWDFHIKKVTF